jgi:ABC-type branched-subunit amino acid transport system ATPase component
MTSILEVDGLKKRFGGVSAVDGCSFSVAEGSITALIGPNGSGKTTVFNLITGYLPADAGRIEFDGRRVARPDPTALYRRGLTRTFQQPRVFRELTLVQNLSVAGRRSRWAMFGLSTGASDRELAEGLLGQFGLRELAGNRAAELSFGQQKLLEFATVLMSRPKLVLLDEPTAGVNPVMAETMERHIRALNAQGISFLIVEHEMSLVMRLCDPIVVLDHGTKLAEGPPAAIQRNPAVLEAYLGT